MQKLLFIIVLLFFIGCETPQEKNKKEIENIKKELSIISNKLDNYKSPNIDEIKQKIKILQTKIDKLNNKEITQQIVKLSKEIKNLHKNDNLGYIVIKPITLITIKKANIYSIPDKSGKIVTQFNKLNTFTSYKEKNGFIKITGYFVDGKWTPNKKEWWIKKSDCKIKIMER